MQRISSVHFYQDTHPYRNPQVLRARHFRAEHFVYDPETDTFVCPADKRLHFQYTSRYTTDNGYESTPQTYECFDCADCRCGANAPEPRATVRSASPSAYSHPAPKPAPT